MLPWNFSYCIYFRTERLSKQNVNPNDDDKRVVQYYDVNRKQIFK